jgi:hypothetical protein
MVFGVKEYLIRNHCKDEADGSIAGAWFALAGVLMFATTLIYQIREFNLQREELVKSVQAQEATSAALEEQRQIMLDQKTESFLFQSIEGFVRFKETEPVIKRVSDFAEALTTKLKEVHLSTLDPVKIIAEVNQHLMITATDQFRVSDIKYSYGELFWKLHYMITSSGLPIEKQKFFHSYIESQLNQEEKILSIYAEQFKEFYIDIEYTLMTERMAITLRDRFFGQALKNTQINKPNAGVAILDVLKFRRGKETVYISV